MRRTLILALALAALSPAARADAPPLDPSAVKWLFQASGEEILRDYPYAAEANGVSGGARLSCKIGPKGELTHCAVLMETPPGYGFGKAALKLAWRYQVDTRGDGQSLVGADLTLPIGWSAQRP